MLSFLQNKHVVLTLLVFGVAVATASNIFILHVETLVLLCFILFLIFAYVLLKDLITSSFNDRALLIEKEFNDSYSLKEQTLVLLAEHHAKQVSLLSEINGVLSFTKAELGKVIQTRQAALRARLVTELRNKLSLALKKEEAFFQYIQESTNNIVMNSILESLEGPDGVNLKNQCFDEGIKLIEQVK
uniref:ATP synthase F0 subunit b n=1 Tax=Histiona aroides TaxID=392300 RepID=M4QD28_HISAR|nr:ATP synthase F0 subunit b [Histiona aroides]AGH24095.1 ATP synthase F0 subunit b [Histiona aroides]